MNEAPRSNLRRPDVAQTIRGLQEVGFDAQVYTIVDGKVSEDPVRFSSSMPLEKIESIDIRKDELRAYAGLSQAGELEVGIYSRREKGVPTRDPSFRGSELLDLFLRLFEGRFKAVHARWYHGDNLDVFNKLVRMGSDLETAARNTWTGKQLTSRGYTVVKVGELTGSRGNFYEVDVIFEKAAID